MEPIVYENILNDQEQNEIKNIMTSDTFNWNMIMSTIDPHERETIDDPNIYDDFPTFFHTFYESGKQSPVFDMAKSILDKFTSRTNIKLTEILRIRANLVTCSKSKPGQYTLPHWDTYEDGNKDLDFMILLYYVIDSDGPTYIFDTNKKIDPNQGKFVLFKNQKHAASFPIENNLRIVINFNIRFM